MLNQRVAGDEIDPKRAVIEVHVRDLAQLFNSMDPSPFLDKDLDVDAEEFIVSWARELADDSPIALRVHLDRASVDMQEGKMLGEAIHTYFRHRAELMQRRLRDLLRRGRTSLIIGLVVVSASILIGDWIANHVVGAGIGDVIRESLLIGGWVAMWRPMEIFLYDWWPIRNERRVLSRLSQSAVRIVCNQQAPPVPEVPYIPGT